MTTPVHDPKIKQELKDELHAALYAPVQRHFKAKLDAIIQHNVQLCASNVEAFTYKGEIYKINPNQRVPLRVDRLDQSLRPVMDSYLAELDKLNREELPFALGYITKVLNSSNDLRDYLKLLPSALHPIVQKAIDKCPCRTEALSVEFANQFKVENKRELDMVMSRLMENLLFP